MNDLDFKFEHQDRLAKIRAINEQHNLYEYGAISFSGGKDSRVASELVDEALPNNEIPRIFVDTGIEYQAIRKYVYELAKKDKRIVIIKPRVNIKKMLNKEGYPFKSKQHSQNYGVYFRNRVKIQELVKKIENEPNLAFNYDFIHNLERGTKGIIKYIFGVRERERVLYEYSDCP